MVDNDAMRLATYNIRHGLGADGSTDPDRYSRAVRDLDADILSLQEVERGARRSGRVDHVALAAEALGAHDARFAPTLRKVGPLRLRASRYAGHGSALWDAGARRPDAVGVPGAGVADSGPRAGVPAAPSTRPPAGSGLSSWYGIGLVSRYPVLRWIRLELPLAPFSERLRDGVRRQFSRDPATGRRTLPMPDEPRVALAAVVQAPQGELTVVATHLTVRGGGAAGQLAHLVSACAGLPRPLVLLGDLNMVADRPAATSGWLPLATALTIPVGRPVRQIDHILADGDLSAFGGPRDGRAVDTGLSDHLALVVDLAE